MIHAGCALFVAYSRVADYLRLAMLTQYNAESLHAVIFCAHSSHQTLKEGTAQRSLTEGRSQ